MFNNAEDVYDYFSIAKEGSVKERNERLTRAFYKYTECGGWLSVIAPGERIGGKEVQKWRAYAKIVEGHFKLVALSYEAIPRRIYFPSHENVPPEVLEYFDPECMNDPPATDEAYVSSVDAAYASELGLEDRGWTRPTNIDVTKMVPHKGGILIGSIVEGSDAEVTEPPLYFPFSIEEFDEAMARLDDETSRLWDEANADEKEEDL